MDQAESLRNMIRQHNQAANKEPAEEKTARIIAVTSGKGGVGKSNTSINLGLNMSKRGKKVIILDADFGLANIEVMFGVSPKYTLADLMYNDMELEQIISRGPEGIGFISGGSGIAKLANVETEDIKKVVSKLSRLSNLADVVIVDTGAGIAPSVLEFLAASPEVILVTTPEPTSIYDAYALIKALNLYEGYDKNYTKVRLVANKVMSSKEGVILHEKLNSVSQRFLSMNIELLGCIPQDNCISKSVMKQTPVSLMYPTSAAAKAYADITDKLLQSDNEGMDDNRGVRSFFGKLFRR